MIDIVIVNWNAGELLDQCLDSISTNAGDFVSSVVVVDNGSTDGSDEYASGHDGVNLVRAGENLGFGKGCNKGARECSADFLLFLNPDARLLPGTLQSCAEFMNSKANQNVGICGAQLLDEDMNVTRSCSRFPSLSNIFARASGLDRLRPEWGPRMNEWDHSETREVDQVMGAFFMIRRDLFEQVRGFDERFFVYFEEVDLNRRCHDLGWRTWFLADAKSVHIGGGTSEKVKARRLFYSLRSRLQYGWKHFGFAGSIVVFGSTMIVEPLARTTLLLARGKIDEAVQTWKAYGMLSRWLLTGQPKR
jgi:hypothetical protein